MIRMPPLPIRTKVLIQHQKGGESLGRGIAHSGLFCLSRTRSGTSHGTLVARGAMWGVTGMSRP